MILDESIKSDGHADAGNKCVIQNSYYILLESEYFFFNVIKLRTKTVHWLMKIDGRIQRLKIEKNVDRHSCWLVKKPLISNEMMFTQEWNRIKRIKSKQEAKLE